MQVIEKIGTVRRRRHERSITNFAGKQNTEARDN
jgi:hypothetical protein